MAVHFDPQLLQPVLKESGAFLTAVFCDHYAAHIETMAFEDGHETQYIHIVGDAQISADLVFLNIVRADHDDDLRLGGELHEHAHLAVGLKPGENPGSVIIVEQLAAELQIKLVVKMADPFPDVGGLHLQILFVVKSCFHSHSSYVYIVLVFLIPY